MFLPETSILFVGRLSKSTFQNKKETDFRISQQRKIFCQQRQCKKFCSFKYKAKGKLRHLLTEVENLKIIVNVNTPNLDKTQVHLAWIEHQFLSGIRESRKAQSLWGIMRGVEGVRKSIHQSWLAKSLGLGLLCWGFKGVQEEIPREEASTLQIGSVAFPAGQYTSPQFHPCHRLFDPRWTSGQFLSLLMVLTLLSVTFGYSLSSEAVVIRHLRRWKRLWRRSLTRSHKRTCMGPWRSCWNGTTSTMQMEEITLEGTRVLCVYYQ